MMMGVDHPGLGSLGARELGRQHSRGTERGGAGEQLAPRHRRVAHRGVTRTAEAMIEGSPGHRAVSSSCLHHGAVSAASHEVTAEIRRQRIPLLTSPHPPLCI
jgi:hypothetical protein